MFFGTKKHRSADGRITCICLPHAGGSSTIFSPWEKLLAPHVELRPVCLPGRGPRFNQPLYSDFDAVIHDLLPATREVSGESFFFLGHSLGALLAYELAYRLETEHACKARALFVAGASAPDLVAAREVSLEKDAPRLTDEQLLERLHLLGGLSEEIRDSPELLALALPVIRADLAVHSSYSIRGDAQSRKVSCPIVALGGIDDLGNVSEDSLRRWMHFTRAEFSLCLFSGNHFFLHAQADLIAGIILNRLQLDD